MNASITITIIITGIQDISMEAFAIINPQHGPA
jgi:hypothetical protein